MKFERLILPLVFFLFPLWLLPQSKRSPNKQPGSPEKTTQGIKVPIRVPVDSSAIDIDHYLGAHFGHPGVINLSFAARFSPYMIRLAIGTAFLVPPLGNIHGFQLDFGYALYDSKKFKLDLLFPILYTYGGIFKDTKATDLAFGPAFSYNFFGFHVLSGIVFGESSYGTWSIRPLLQIGYAFQVDD